VVWYRNGLDITGDILADINRDTARVGAQPPAGGAARSPFQR